LRQDDDEFDLSSLHDLELNDGDEDAQLYDPSDHPPPKTLESSQPAELPVQIPHTPRSSGDSFEYVFVILCL
jgi:hypothetical protein